MGLRDWLTIIAIVAGLGGSIIVVVLTDMRVFQVYPDFDVKASIDETVQNRSQNLIVENIGRVQAKAATIYILSNNPMKINDEFCLESESHSNVKKDIFELSFAKMSTGLPCAITFDSQKNTEIKSVIIIADDSPGRTFLPASKTSQPLTNMTTIIFSETGYYKQRLYDISMSLIIFELASAIFVFVYMQWRRKKLRKIYEISEKEVRDKLEKEWAELDFLNKSTILQEFISPKLKERIFSLQERVIADARDLDEITSKINSYRSLHKKIEEFFEKWTRIESQLIVLAGKYQIDILGESSPSIIIEELQRRGFIPESVMTEFESLHKFRNMLAHGMIKTNSKMLDDKNSRLDKLWSELAKCIRE